MNPILKAAIPNHELVQILHHTFSLGVNTCVFVVGSNSSVMAVYRVNLKNFILDSYKDICDHFFKNDLKLFYIPNKQVPNLPREWVNAFQNKLLKFLKLDVESFKQMSGLWRMLNVNICSKKKKIKRSKIPTPFVQQ